MGGLHAEALMSWYCRGGGGGTESPLSVFLHLCLLTLPEVAFPWPPLHPPLRWHLNRSSMVSYLGMPRPPLHISLALLLQALDFLAPVVLDVWSGHVLMASSFLTQCPISILYILFPPRVLPSLPTPFLSIGSLAGFSHFHDFNPLSSPPGPQCLGSAKPFSLGYPLAARLSWGDCQTNFSSSHNFTFL